MDGLAGPGYHGLQSSGGLIIRRGGPDGGRLPCLDLPRWGCKKERQEGMSRQSPESDLGARLKAATDAAKKRTWKDTFSHPTWPGEFVLLGEKDTMWRGRSKRDSWWTRYEALKGKAEILADDSSKTKRVRDTARKLCGFVDEFLALGTPTDKGDNLWIVGFKKARDHWEKINGPGMKMRKAAEVLGLASYDDPIYVPTGDELKKHAREHIRAVDAAIAEVRAAGTKPPLTPDAAVSKSIAQRLRSFFKVGWALTVEKFAKGMFDSLTKRP